MSYFKEPAEADACMTEFKMLILFFKKKNKSILEMILRRPLYRRERETTIKSDHLHIEKT